MALFRKKEPPGQPSEEIEKEPPLPKGPSCAFWVVAVVAAAAIIAGLVLTMKKVEADQVGLRVVILGLGIWDEGTEHAKPLPPGWHPIVPWFHEFAIYQKNIQTFEMTSKTGGIRKPDYHSLEIRTSDGYKVNVDFSIFYNVLEGRAGLVRSFYRNDQEIKEKGIQAVAPGIIQSKLSELAYAQDFYNSELRMEKSQTAVLALNKIFFNQGVEIRDIMIRDFEFPQEYEAAILSKALAEQLKRVQESLARAAESEAVWKKAIAEADAAATIERTRGQAEARKIESEGERAKTEMVAEGDRAKLSAEGRGKGRLAQALSGPGGKAYVGLEYTKVLEGLELIILPAGKNGINPLDAEQMLRSLETR